jgi:hypothetical protein
MNAFRSALGIHSPSKEFAALGVQLPRGVEAGIEDGKPALDRGVRDMVKTPSAPARAPQAAATSSSKPSIQIDAINIQTSAGDARTIAQDIRAALEDVLSGIQIQIGVTS